jgi:lipoprotein-anchoring transpeptidase ErfK/SrfK
MRITEHYSARRWILACIPLLSLPISGASAEEDLRAAGVAVQLTVDLSARELYVIEGGEVARTYSVAVGTRKHPTPQGTFRTGRIDWNPRWVPPDSEWARKEKPRAPGDPKNPMRGVKIYFRAPAYYIHGTNAPGSIGEAASHGCIRMREEDAKSLARWIESNGGTVRLVIRA